MYSNTDLVDHLINTDILISSNITDAFLDIDRADFVRFPESDDRYRDYPLPIGWGQTISQPSTVVMMLEMLGVKKGDKVLDIGSGSGWTTALLSHIVGDEGSVTGVERIDELVKFGNENLKKYNFKNTKIIKAEEELGIKGKQFDRILISASAKKFPLELIAQLKTGGKIVIPVGESIYEGTKESNDELKVVKHYGFVFVPLIY